MNRVVQPELLDQLPAQDLDARRSRRDLQLLNRLMRNDRALLKILRPIFNRLASVRLAELGAGDGTLLLRLAERATLAPQSVAAILVDKQNLLEPATLARFATRGWKVEIIEQDVFDWLRAATASHFDEMIANLFLHHFSEAQLR